MSNLMNNPLFRIVRGVFIIAFLTMVWLVIFSAIDTSGSEIDYEPFQGASIVFAVLSYIIIVFLFQYHKVVNLKESIKSSYSAIEIKEQYVEKLIAESGYNVSLSGNLRQEQLAEEFNRGDIFVLPSFYDGLPLVLAESMACGMQVVCSDLPGIRPWMDAHVPHHTIRFVKPPRMHDADVPDPATLPGFEQELAEAIREAAEHPYLQRPDLSLVSWPGVCRRILSAR